MPEDLKPHLNNFDTYNSIWLDYITHNNSAAGLLFNNSLFEHTSNYFNPTTILDFFLVSNSTHLSILDTQQFLARGTRDVILNMRWFFENQATNIISYNTSVAFQHDLVTPNSLMGTTLYDTSSNLLNEMFSITHLKTDALVMSRFIPEHRDTLEMFEVLSVNTDNSLYAHLHLPDTKLYYPEPFIASPSFNHEELWFIHILHYQHWLWFFFISLIMMFFITFINVVRWSNPRNRPKRETRGVSRSKCADLITACVPVSWAAAIIISESVDAADYYDGFGTGEILIGIRGYQWGWEYYFPWKLEHNDDVQPAYASVTGNSFRYVPQTELDTKVKSFWKSMRCSNRLSSGTTHALISPSDNSQVLRFINFKTIGPRTLSKTNAFRRLQASSKTNQTALFNSPSDLTLKYVKLNNLYLNDLRLQNSVSPRTSRDLTYSSLNSSLNSLETHLDNKSISKLLSYNLYLSDTSNTKGSTHGSGILSNNNYAFITPHKGAYGEKITKNHTFIRKQPTRMESSGMGDMLRDQGDARNLKAQTTIPRTVNLSRPVHSLTVDYLTANKDSVRSSNNYNSLPITRKPDDSLKPSEFVTENTFRFDKANLKPITQSPTSFENQIDVLQKAGTHIAPAHVPSTFLKSSLFNMGSDARLLKASGNVEGSNGAKTFSPTKPRFLFNTFWASVWNQSTPNRTLDNVLRARESRSNVVLPTVTQYAGGYKRISKELLHRAENFLWNPILTTESMRDYISLQNSSDDQLRTSPSNSLPTGFTQLIKNSTLFDVYLSNYFYTILSTTPTPCTWSNHHLLYSNIIWSHNAVSTHTYSPFTFYTFFTKSFSGEVNTIKRAYYKSISGGWALNQLDLSSYYECLYLTNTLSYLPVEFHVKSKSLYLTPTSKAAKTFTPLQGVAEISTASRGAHNEFFNWFNRNLERNTVKDSRVLYDDVTVKRLRELSLRVFNINANLVNWAPTHLNKTSLFAEDYYTNPGLVPRNGIFSRSPELLVDSMSDTYAASKAVDYVHYLNYTNINMMTMSGNTPLSYLTTLGVVAKNFENYEDDSEYVYDSLGTVPNTTLSEHDLRSTNYIKLRTSNLAYKKGLGMNEKLSQSRLEHGASHIPSAFLSNTAVQYPAISESPLAYKKLLGKNTNNFLDVTLYKQSLTGTYSSTTPITNSLNTYFTTIPFLLGKTGDAMLYSWVDWYSRLRRKEVQPAPVSRYHSNGLLIISKNFDYGTLEGSDLFNKVDLYTTRVLRLRKNYMPSWALTPYLYTRVSNWYLSDKFVQGTLGKPSLSKLYTRLNRALYFPSNAITFNHLTTPSIMDISSPNRSAWKPTKGISGYAYTSSMLVNLLTKREYLYREYFLNVGYTITLPAYLLSTPTNPLLNEVRKSYNFIDPTTYITDARRDLYYESLVVDNFSLKTQTLSWLKMITNSNKLLKTFTYLTRSDFDDRIGYGSELYRTQYRPMRKGISNMIRLHADGAISLPVEMRLHIMASSRDIIHSWSLPSAGIKIDCIPGYSSHRVTIFFLSGVFWGQCMEICGRYHHWMPIIVYFQKLDLFLLWCSHFIIKEKVRGRAAHTVSHTWDVNTK